MDVKKVVAVLIIILLLAGGGYYIYNQYILPKLEENRESENRIYEILSRVPGEILNLSNEVAEVKAKVAADTLKIESTPTDKTYTELKDKIIELEKDKEKNKEEITKLKDDISERRQEFLAADERYYISLVDGQKLLFHRDDSGALMADSDNIKKIIEHREIESIEEKVVENDVVEEEKKTGFKAGVGYTFNEEYNIILSKELFAVKDVSGNVSMGTDFEFEEISLSDLWIGADLGYDISEDLEIGGGYNTDKTYYIRLSHEF